MTRGTPFLPALTAVLLAALLALACAPSGPDLTYRVERRAFEHRVGAEGVLRAETATPLIVPQDVRRMVRLAWLAPDGSAVSAGDVVARFDPNEMQERLEEGRADLRSADLETEKSRIESAAEVMEVLTKHEIAELELDVARRFQKTDDAVFSRQDIIESQIDQELAEERKQHAEVSRTTRESLSRTELDLLAIRKRQAQSTVDQALEGLDALEVRAPHAGILTLARDWRGERVEAGTQMWRGQQIGSIPDLDTMEAEVFVLEADAGGLAVGKPAEVVLEADPGTVYTARIRQIEPVAKPRFRGSPVQYFGVALSFDPPPERPLKPGQRVRATLFLQRIEDALVVPRQAVVREGGEARVLVQNGRGFEPRRVTIGASSPGLVVIAEGLSEGEVIALGPPRGAAPASPGAAAAPIVGIAR